MMPIMATVSIFFSLRLKVAVLLGQEAQPQAVALMEAGAKKIQSAAQETFRIKLGFLRDSEKGTELWEELEPLMRTSDKISVPLCSRKMFAMQQVG